MGEKGRPLRRRCIVCNGNGIRKDSTYFCEACEDKPALCLKDCFKAYHKNYIEIILQGKRGIIYQKDGYLYRNKVFRNGRRYVQCRDEDCGSTAIFREGEAAEIWPSPHNHLPDEVEVEVLRFKADLKQRALNERRLTSREVFDAVSLQYPRAAVRIGFPQVRATFARCRRLRSRPIPNSLLDLQNPRWEELGRTLAEDSVGQTFFRDVIGPGGQDGWHAAVYLSSRLQVGLINTRRVHLDATYKVLPVQLGAHLQLLTAHAEYLNQFHASYYDDFTANALYCPV
ncbi:hypothetical protein J6590_063144 [Homalodisca vitripennis]|nr:hypothetical protein J6590_063144 [Homalodisca vitripennis]